MWLRNFDNLQVIRLNGAVESATPDFFGDGSLSLKKTSGYVTPLQYSTIAESSSTSKGICNNYPLKISDFSSNWNDATSLSEFEEKIDSKGLCLIFGSNNTEVSYDDYTIEPFMKEEEKLKLSFVSQGISSLIYNQSNGKFYSIMDKTVRNDNEEDITINELGIIIGSTAKGTSTSYPWNYYNNNNTSSGGIFLLYREVLENPITLRKGELYTFNIKFEIQTNNNNLIT